MPTMKEISEALREAAKTYDLLQANRTFGWEYWKQNQNTAKQLSTQVEQMRCDTCAHWDSTPPSTCLYPASEMDNDGAFIEDCGPNFGCWHWKEKEVKNG